MRTIYNLNQDWLFSKEFNEQNLTSSYNPSNFYPIDLPHTFNDSDAASGLEFYRGQTIYRKKFNCTEVLMNQFFFLNLKQLV